MMANTEDNVILKGVISNAKIPKNVKEQTEVCRSYTTLEQESDRSEQKNYAKSMSVW